MMKSYQELLNRLLTVNVKEGVKLGLQNCFDLDHLLKNPSQAFPVIHVAGTNGKGSVSTKIAASYQAAGFKTGLYTSPHISCFRERIRINGQMISEEDVQKHLSHLFLICEQHRIKATFFELTTMMAFLHFATEKVDIAILEVGLGGRLDATNISKSILSIITSISLEHTEILGDTIEAITIEKAGIIKSHSPIVIGPTVPASVIGPIASKNECEYYQVTGAFDDYHAENCAIAKKAMEVLSLDSKFIEIGLKELPACRLETFIINDKTVILDVAHNPNGLQQLLKAIHLRYPEKRLRFVIGLSTNKDIAGCLNFLKDKAEAFHLIEGSNERSAPKEILAKELAKMGVSSEKVIVESSIEEAVHHAMLLAGHHEIVIVCGTFFIMSEARHALGIEEPQDRNDMN